MGPQLLYHHKDPGTGHRQLQRQHASGPPVQAAAWYGNVDEQCDGELLWPRHRWPAYDARRTALSHRQGHQHQVIGAPLQHMCRCQSAVTGSPLQCARRNVLGCHPFHSATFSSTSARGIPSTRSPYGSSTLRAFAIGRISACAISRTRRVSAFAL